VALYERAANRGYAHAMNRVADAYRNALYGFPRDFGQAAYWYGKSAAQRDPFAMVRLGELYEFGAGVDQDPRRARELYLDAANDPSEIGKQARFDLAQMNSQASQAPPPQDRAADPSGIPLELSLPRRAMRHRLRTIARRKSRRIPPADAAFRFQRREFQGYGHSWSDRDRPRVAAVGLKR
jgi:hypothetical protein